jgi:hypothetical protein
MRREGKIGILLIAVYLLLNQFAKGIVPDFILGVLMGAGLFFELIGVLSTKKYVALKNWKKSLIHDKTI